MKASECMGSPVYRALRRTTYSSVRRPSATAGRPTPILTLPRRGESGSGESLGPGGLGRVCDVVTLEPGQDVVDLRDHARGLAGDAVRAFGHAYHHRIDASELERLVVLLGLRNRRAVVVLAGDQQRRRGDVADQRQRRALPVVFEFLPGQARKLMV